jgi:ferredoxin
MSIKVLAEKCQKDQECPAIASCPVGAISRKDKNSPPVIDPAKCIECELCTTICPHGAFVRED